MSTGENLKRTPLYAAHVAAGAKMVAFGGWEMPLHYAGILAEHAAVRERIGLFDISHMGELLVAGPQAESVLNYLLTNDVRNIAEGQAQYSLLCNEHGGTQDDLIVYRLEPSVYLLVVNAFRIEADFAWMNRHAQAPAVLDNASDRYAAFALQGPAAPRVLTEAAAIHPFHTGRCAIAGKHYWVARTGYTGEDGFEIIGDAADAIALWTTLLERGREFGIQRCGLGARDTLRLEMGYSLYGQDLAEDTTPLEAGLGRFVSFDKGEFVGRDALARQRDAGVARRLVAFKMTRPAPPPRPHYPIVSDSRPVGQVTSGAPSPTLGVGIGLGYVETATAQPGTRCQIEIRGRRFPAEIVPKPILRRGP